MGRILEYRFLVRGVDAACGLLSSKRAAAATDSETETDPIETSEIVCKFIM